MTPFIPTNHCPQCNGGIDQRCSRTSSVASKGIYPRRQTEVWCDHCSIGWRITYELCDGNWQIDSGVTRLAGDTARSIRTFAENQLNVIHIRKAS